MYERMNGIVGKQGIICRTGVVGLNLGRAGIVVSSHLDKGYGGHGVGSYPDGLS